MAYMRGSIIYSRVISFLLVGAVLACPLSCKVGACHIDGCCSGGADSACEQCAEAEDACSGECCCCDEASNQDESRGPDRCPKESMCQGVCGGAIFEEPCMLEEADVSFLLPLPDIYRTATTSQLKERTGLPGFSGHLTSKNQGCFLRILHMSLLC